MSVTQTAAMETARKELDLLRKAQLIQNSSGAASFADRKAVANKVMEILYEVHLLEESEPA